MRHLLAFLLLFYACTAFAQDGEAGVTYLTKDSLSYSLTQNWVLKQGDDTAWAHPDFDDSDWMQVHPELKKEDNPDLDYNGIVWLRQKIQTDSSLKNTLLALSVFQQGASEVYVNGKLIETYGEIGEDEASTEYYSPQGLPLIMPPDSNGTYVIALRYAKYDARDIARKYSSVTTGFMMRVNQADDAIFQMRGWVILMGIFSLIMFGLFAALAIVHFILWLYHKQDRANLYYSIFSLCLSLVFFTPYVVYTASNPKLALWGSYLGLVLSSILLISLSGLSNVLFYRSKIRFYIIAAVCLVPVVVSYFDLLSGYGILFMALIVVVLESIVVTVIAMYRRQKGSGIVGVGVLFFTGFLLTVAIVAIIGGNIRIDNSTTGAITGLLALGALLSIPVSMSVYLAVGFARMNKDLNKQLKQVKELSEKNLAQEQEKKHLLETQNERLEKEVAERTSEIVAEKHKSDELLRNILPEEIAEELKQKGTSEARYFDHVTVIFTDFVGFTKAGERLSPQELVDELDTCFKAFDNIISKYDIEKIKTIGDAYLAVSGLPAPDNQHAVHTVQAAMEIMAFMNKRRQEYPNKSFDIRIGIHSGAVVAGIVGVKKFAYDIWGDTVNTAARMESSSEPNKINISYDTYELVKDHFDCAYRGEVAAKNKGEMDMYFVESQKGTP